MKKQIGSILLIAGTCIGSGMIALPLVLAKLGLIPSIILMILTWSIMYFTSLINLELNLQAGQGLSLGALGRLYSGRLAELIGTISLKLLSYSLLSVFIYGGSSIIQKLLESPLHTYELSTIATCYSAIAIVLLLLPIKFIDYINRTLFVGLIAIVTTLIIGLIVKINWGYLPLISEQASNFLSWKEAVPVVFTSFGFQVIFHSLTNYCNKDAKILKKAFLWGSLIPAIVYIIWTCSVLTVVHNENYTFYQQMVIGKVEIGELIKELSQIAKWPSVQLLVWVVSLLAIVTSVLGVGVGLCDSLKMMLAKILPQAVIRNILAALITILPAYFIALLVPNAFITVLGFAGMILVIIAILLPIYLFFKMNTKKLYYLELKANWLIILSAIIGLIIIYCEVTK
ncbi:MAG: tyrp5 [Rickettsiaceae bacterium]|jgi:tyrosine-specific transport protein|nr:tyrp5 [Rickettsiaceae bacterium]